MEEQYETIKNERSANFGDTEATYRKLLVRGTIVVLFGTNISILEPL